MLADRLEAVRQALRLDAIWFLPAALPPHKLEYPISSFADRLAMLELAIGGRPACAVSALEAELLAAVNQLGIGPMGLGGLVTCLDVHLKIMPCHIASLPVAVNVQCHSSRHAEAVL